jgi:L-asparaginase
MQVAFVQTGGTIDKDYPRTENSHGYNFEIGNPVFEDILRSINPLFDWHGYSVLRKDSLDMNDEDRQEIYDGVTSLSEEKIVITHGTDTVYETARKLASIRNKFIVMTGAMLPGKFASSDAMFNLGMAVGALQTLRDPGVYISLYGRIVPWNEYPELACQRM